ncbi:MAG: hypothetical protein AW08_03517 [Candidatus Accumulibacter adjunctus]|uniref:Uncharacterized protein n=1 Tax=Candidatus Accumulibacter adjunctus TaxID=1454001 RepID=A0A011PFN4_9PROT|nr:MAG: hypothetical protein AW08_03517 [Candidatus Accumulibacter adjunctus]
MPADCCLARQTDRPLEEAVPDDHPERPVIDDKALFDMIQDLLRETLGLQACRDVLHHGDEEVHAAVLMTNGLHVRRHIDHPAILANESLVGLEAVARATAQTFEVHAVGSEIVGVGEPRPAQLEHLVARMTENFAQAVVEMQPAHAVGRKDRHADEWKIKEEAEQAVLLDALRSQFELVRSPLLAQQQQDQDRDGENGQACHEADPENQSAQRRQDLIAIDLRHQMPRRTADRSRRCENSDPAVIGPLHDLCAAHQDGAGCRQLRIVEGLTEDQCGVRAMAQLVQIEDPVCVSAHQQGLGGRTRRRPALDQRKDDPFDRSVEDDGADHAPPAIHFFHQRRDPVQVDTSRSAPIEIRCRHLASLERGLQRLAYGHFGAAFVRAGDQDRSSLVVHQHETVVGVRPSQRSQTFVDALSCAGIGIPCQP